MSAERAVVIGSGFGGLAAAIRLRRMGYAVQVVEALDQPGGRARVFRRDGFTFDAGPTVITAPYLLAELFELAGRDMRDYLELIPVDPFYRVMFHDGSQFDYVWDEARMLAQIEAFEPRDVDGYRRLSAHAERIFDTGYTELADRPFGSVTDMLRVLPAMMRLRSYRTVYGAVSSYIRDERLRQLFTFEPLLVGGNPFTTTSIYLLIHWLERKWGGALRARRDDGHRRRARPPAGGARRGGTVERAGGAHPGRRRRCAWGGPGGGGERIPAGVVVSNADPSHVFRTMLAPGQLGRVSALRVRRTRASMGLFVAYFGARRQYPELAHHTILLGPRYRGLLDDIFRRKVLADDFSLYLHAPTRTDPTLGPAGCETFYVLSPVPNGRAGIDWERQAEPYFERIRAHLESRLLPGLGASLVSPSFLTPREFERDLRSVDGAAFGPEPILTQSAYFRYPNRSPDVEGLYFVGAGTHPGGGIPGVLNSARVLERVAPRPTPP